ncbi:MAG: zf-HC2 domain-containing protein [Anaerolineaceae bacterium]|nr:MAG: zf-HC2 domain-containing protein [Anaerolineaceae bacterium]
MTCIEAQSLITAFINDELNINEQEEFLEHVESCEECREELEVYYALLTAMKQLDEDKHLSNDYSQELKDKIEHAQERIIHLRYNYYRKKGVLIMIILSMSIFFSLYHYFIPKEEVNPVKESRFQLRTSFMENRFDKPTNELNRYFEELEGNKAIGEIE